MAGRVLSVVKIQVSTDVCATLHIKYTIESFIYSTAAQLDCSKNVKIYIKIYVRGAPTCFGFSQPSSGSYYIVGS